MASRAAGPYPGPMSYSLNAALAAAVLVASLVVTALRPNRSVPWWVPAGFSLAFLSFSVPVMVQEGPLGFWPNHTTNGWGNQVWFDLLLALGAGFAGYAARARNQGMLLWLWALTIVATGSIGYFATIARLLYLEGRASSR
jgi:hypothetical protein